MCKRIDHFIDTYVVFDLETTGLSCYEHEIIEIVAFKVENNRVVDTYSSFVKPKNNILGHNIISFDMKFINVASEALYGEVVHNDYIDTLLLSLQYLKNLKSQSLSSLCQYYDIDTTGVYRALADCEMTNRVYQTLKQVHRRRTMVEIGFLY